MYSNVVHVCVCLQFLRMFQNCVIAFNLFDKDRDGSISLQEVMSAMETLGQKVDYEKVKESFKQVDLRR